MEHHFTFELCSHARQVLALGFGDTQLFVGGLHLLGKVIPFINLRICGTQVVEDVLEVDVGHVVGEPRRHGLLLEQVQAALAELRHPLGLALPPRNLVDDGLAETLLGFEGVFNIVAPTERVLTEIEIE